MLANGIVAHNCLGFGYGMGYKKFVASAYNAGYAVTESDSKAFHAAYWRLFSGVKRLSDRLAGAVGMRGYIVNPFGYRLVCPPRKAFNAFIQSSVSGIMHVYCAKLYAMAPYAIFRTVIHDEAVSDCPIDRLDDFRKAKELATKSLNEDLGWSVDIRVGFAVGPSWYEAK